MDRDDDVVLYQATPPRSAYRMEFVLDASDVTSLSAHLERLVWIAGEPILSVQRIGGGNMNMTVRVRTPDTSFILKQARPFVVKYPQIPAPVERAAVEAAFYRAVAETEGVADWMPRLIGFDESSNLLWLEDLGEESDYMSIYRRGELAEETCRDLTQFLRRLHEVSIPPSDARILANRAMRKLNHEHQYELPLRTESARGLRANARYCERIAQLGELYLADGPVLLHGDFFPGSWLATSQGVRIIDPEFCFPGPREYDLGIFLAHLVIIRARRLWDVVMEEYGDTVIWPLARRFAGVEIMRRLIGVAQLPLAADDQTKLAWLAESQELVCAD